LGGACPYKEQSLGPSSVLNGTRQCAFSNLKIPLTFTLILRMLATFPTEKKPPLSDKYDDQFYLLLKHLPFAKLIVEKWHVN